MPPIIINPPRKMGSSSETTCCDVVGMICLLSFFIFMVIFIIIICCPSIQLTLFKVTSGYEKPEDGKIRIYEYCDMVDEIFDNIDTVIRLNHDYIKNLYDTFDDYDKLTYQMVEYVKKFRAQEGSTNRGISYSRLAIADISYREYHSREKSKFDISKDEDEKQYFLNGITAIIDKIDGFISGEKEYIDKLDKKDEDLKKLHKKLEKFVANGMQFIRTAIEISKKTGDNVDN